MIDMVALNKKIEAGRRELSSNDNIKGVLSLATRTQIWKAMLDVDDVERSYRDRTHLHMACVRHVQFVWERAFPGDDGIEEMLSLTQELIDRTVDTDEAESRSGSFLNDVEARGTGDPDVLRAAMVADAASHMVDSACYRDLYAEIDEDLVDDDELLPDTLDPSYSCSVAVSGATNSMPVEKTDVAARRAFWLWYLDEAIPAVLAG
ncbi:immunity protein [Actinomyces naeslundii]|uniref:Imm5 family immunity protein n=1 Tax=Actinomyces naeslundii TaxID=1655 RepID=UPI00094C7F9B|nr:Imm5 family immunity protein [Actinomyces naeslundii]OLO92919.1 immunity protein [Actinomyces naeslundii]